MEARRLIGLCLLAGILYVAYTQESKISSPATTHASAAAVTAPDIPFIENYTDSPSAPGTAQQAKTASLDQRQSIKWQYQSSVDEMRGTTNRWATLLSDTAADVGSYRTEVAKLRLDIRTMPKQYGLDVILTIPKGQIHCLYDGCKIPIRFDDGPIITYTADSAESRHDSVFIREKSGFIRRTKQAKKMIIEVPIWRKGAQQFTFSPHGLEWN